MRADAGAAARPTEAARAAIAPFYVMEVMKAAAQREEAGADVLHLEVGQPATPAPPGVIEAAIGLLHGDRLGYTDALGAPALRHRIAAWYLERYGVTIEPDSVAVTGGASGACVLALLACFDVGMRVAVAAPGYPCYRNMLTALGIDAVGIDVDESTRFQLTPDLLARESERTGALDGVMVASPSNPTGTMLGTGELEALVRHCEAQRVRLIADEIYHGITYGRPAPTALAHGADVVVVNSFSKYFSMTGWRLGWLVLPAELVTAVERLAQNLTVAPPTLPQLAGIEAFAAVDHLDAHVARYATNRDILVEALAGMGLTRIAPPDGAFYLWVDVGDWLGPSGFADDSQALCARWLDEIGVAVTPGIDFDPARGHRSVRFSYCGSTDDVTAAMGRLGDWCAGQRR